MFGKFAGGLVAKILIGLAGAGVLLAWANGATSQPDSDDSSGTRPALTATTSIGDAAPVTRRPLFKASDLDGTLHYLGRSPGCKAVAVVFLGTQCPISNGYTPLLNRLAAACEKADIEFFGVISDRSTSRAAAITHSREYQIEFPVLFDSSGALADRLQPTHTPEAVVCDPRGEILYRGAIDDRYAGVSRRKTRVHRFWLADALRAIAADRPIETARTEPIGCLVEHKADPQAGATVTFTRDVAPIVFHNCVNCHRPGAVGPFPLTTYEEVSRRALQVELVIQERIMPPWKPEPDFGHFRNEARLADHEIDVLSAWVAAGLPEGDAADLPPLPTFPDGFQLGQPDLVLEMTEPFSVPADGPDIYQYFVIPTHLPDDRLVAAIEYRPGNARVVHHASFRYDDAGIARQLDGLDPQPGYRRTDGWGFGTGGTLGGWAMGAIPQRFPEGMGRPLAAFSDFVIQSHYHPTGRAEIDQSQVGIYFAPRTATQQVAELFVANVKLEIPAGESRFRHIATYTLPVETTLHAVLPHMHLLGRECRAVAHRPDGSVEPLIAINDWDFNWQGIYYYSEPLTLPAGTRIDFEIVYDNSTSNPLNPHSPPVTVGWGEATTDEMGVCFFDVTCETADELAQLISHNRAYVDSQFQSNAGLR